ncbi:protein KTI12-like protein [Leptotrombidium deliense]|uniref:Protein KTI12 homolog n=1 Tax=Leptotrombidium deliense TaxID=299467 RepID=A0A443SNA4_9ACAR|nr:protein KTI12-like protein [Leptotrombidium deliense]
MPLIVICGIPCSGKSTVSQRLEKYFTEEKKQNVVIVSENDIVENPNSVYESATKEKEVRSLLKSSVQRNLTKDTLVILDALNYIKGFRYELYCVAKEMKNTHCVIECMCPIDEATDRNKKKSIPFGDNLFNEVLNRYEAANSQNRWDSPLFVTTPETELCLHSVYEALYARKAPSANLSTQSQPLSETNFLYELNEKTKDIVNHITKVQQMGETSEICVPLSTFKLRINRPLSSVELNKYRRQFISYTKQHPTSNANVIPTLFIQYLNGIIE